MGSSASKSARATGASARKFPTRPSNTTNQAPTPKYTKIGPTVHPPPQATESKTEGQDALSHSDHITDLYPKAIDLDSRDPGLASRLNTLGAVQPNPHYSPTSTSSLDPQRNQSDILPSDMMQAPPREAYQQDPRDNPALRVLAARQKIQERAEEERNNMGRRNFPGRMYVDAGAIQLALMRRAHGENDSRIEQALSIKKGRLGVLGTEIVETVSV